MNLAARQPEKPPVTQPELDFEFFLPAGQEKFRVWEVARHIHHSRKQVEKLIDEGAFGPVVDCGSGSRASVIIPRSGLVNFLKERKR